MSRPAPDSPIDLTAVVLTLDEERHLPACLESLAWAPRTLVFDSGSTDGTVAIARRAGARVLRHPFENYSRQRQAALEAVETPWVLFVDADERVSSALAAEVSRAVEEAEHAGYWLPRRNVFWGHALRGGGWWPDRQLRLLSVGHSRYDPERAVHEQAEVRGTTGVLSAPLEHINYESRPEFRAKQRAYARMEAGRRAALVGAPPARALLLQPARELKRRLLHLGGWRDGLLGLWLCAMMGYYEWLTLREQRMIARSTSRRIEG